MPEVSVERLTQYSEDDAKQLGWLMMHLSERFSGEPIAAGLLEAIIRSPFHDQLVARMDGRIVGAATLSMVMGAATGAEGYLEDFVTAPHARGQGIGDKVWHGMLDWCSERGVDLNFTSNPRREAAHRFYGSHGAVVRKTTVFHVDVS